MNTKTPYQPKPKDELAPNIFKTKIEGLYFLQFKKHGDDRGFFSELVKIPDLEKIVGFKFNPQQFNFSFSQQNVVRGFHAEKWNKLITATSGKAFCVIADIRPDSPTFKQTESFWIGINWSKEYGSGLFISSGLANSICMIDGPVGYIYSVDQLYEKRDKSGDVAISVFDEELNIEWPIPKEQMILSERDKKAISLQQLLEEQDR